MKKVSVSEDGENWYELPNQKPMGEFHSSLKDQLRFWLGTKTFYTAEFDDGTTIELVPKQEILDWLDKYEE